MEKEDENLHDYWISKSGDTWTVKYFAKENNKIKNKKYKTDEPKKLADWILHRALEMPMYKNPLSLKIIGTIKKDCDFCLLHKDCLVFSNGKKICYNCMDTNPEAERYGRIKS